MSDRAKGFKQAAKRKQEGEGYAEKKEAEEAATGEEVEPKKRLNVKLPERLHEEFKAKCEAEGRTMSWVVIEAVRDYVSTDE